MTSEPHFISLADVAGFTLAPGARAHALFGEGAMLNLVELEPGAVVAMHSHPHEQLGIVLRGSLMMLAGGAEYPVAELHAYVLPPDVEHGGTAGGQGALVLDVFVPVREDYRQAARDATGDATG